MMAQNVGLLIGSLLAGVVAAGLLSVIDSAFRRRQERIPDTLARQ